MTETSKAPTTPAGLSFVRAIKDGHMRPPPMAETVGFDIIEAEIGSVGMRLAYDRKLDNGMGMLHGGATATILDTAMGCAAGTVVPDDTTLLTLDLHVTYLSPVTPEVMPITAAARVGHVGRGTVYVLGEVHDTRGQLVAHAVGNFKVVARPRKATA